jgi:DNA polymerase-3 subunit alpha
VLNDAVRMIRQNRGVEIALEKLPLDDQPTYALFGRADTTGIFQFESQGMRDILRRYQPTRIEDLTALNALYRPGPIQGGMTDDFIARKHGRKKVTYDLPELQEILEETCGVIIYQEHVMQIANRLAGFSLGEADILRRAMGKKKAAEMAAQRQKFLTGCQARKVPAKKAERIFDLMEEFAGYGFPKAHSCAYALLAYQTAYLKVHYPVEFMAALLTCETGKNDKVVKYIHEARGMGITVLPPDVNTSDMDFTPVGDAIRFGLRSVKNVGENTVLGIFQAREKLGRFHSLFEFCDNVDNHLLNRRVLESLVRSGAMDCLGSHRAQLMAVLDSAMERSQRLQHAENIGQHGLFGGKAAQESSTPSMPEVEAWPEHELLAAEFATMGFYISGHPLDKYAGRLGEMGVTDLVALEERGDGADVILAGIIVQARVARSRRGARWGAYTLQDRTGLAELLVFSETFERLESLFTQNIPLMIKGRIAMEEREGQESGRALRVRVDDARPLEKMAPGGPDRLRIRIQIGALGNGDLDRLRDIFLRQPGRCRVVFDLVQPGGDSATVDASSTVKADESLLNAVRQIFGDEAVVVN